MIFRKEDRERLERIDKNLVGLLLRTGARTDNFSVQQALAKVKDELRLVNEHVGIKGTAIEQSQGKLLAAINALEHDRQADIEQLGAMLAGIRDGLADEIAGLRSEMLHLHAKVLVFKALAARPRKRKRK